MSLPKTLLDILACPQCKSSVVAVDDQSALLCHSCKVSYPVRDGIPVMLIDEATPLDAD